MITEKIDTLNRCLVGSTGEKVVIAAPPRMMSKQEALVFAAWIVVLADESEGYADFNKVLEAVQNS